MDPPSKPNYIRTAASAPLFTDASSDYRYEQSESIASLPDPPSSDPIYKMTWCGIYLTDITLFFAGTWAVINFFSIFWASVPWICVCLFMMFSSILAVYGIVFHKHLFLWPQIFTAAARASVAIVCCVIMIILMICDLINKPFLDSILHCILHCMGFDSKDAEFTNYFAIFLVSAIITVICLFEQFCLTVSSVEFKLEYMLLQSQADQTFQPTLNITIDPNASYCY